MNFLIIQPYLRRTPMTLATFKRYGGSTQITSLCLDILNSIGIIGTLGSTVSGKVNHLRVILGGTVPIQRTITKKRFTIVSTRNLCGFAQTSIELPKATATPVMKRVTSTI